MHPFVHCQPLAYQHALADVHKHWQDSTSKGANRCRQGIMSVLEEGITNVAWHTLQLRFTQDFIQRIYFGLYSQFWSPQSYSSKIGSIFLCCYCRSQGVKLTGVELSKCSLTADPLVVIQNCSFREAVVIMKDAKFNANANINGAASIEVSSGCHLQLEDSLFQDNAGRFGAALNIKAGASVSIGNSTFVGNAATLQGGAITMNNATLSITSSNFTSNRAAGNGSFGGAISAQVLADTLLLFVYCHAPIFCSMCACVNYWRLMALAKYINRLLSDV